VFKIQPKDNYKYEWILPEGCLVAEGKNSPSVSVNWNKQNGKIILVETASDGCVYKHSPLVVKVKSR
jgi:hypothetical protein